VIAEHDPPDWPTSPDEVIRHRDAGLIRALRPQPLHAEL
jgi:hypothetical protein